MNRNHVNKMFSIYPEDKISIFDPYLKDIENSTKSINQDEFSLSF